MQLLSRRIVAGKDGEIRIRAMADLQKGDPGFRRDLWARFLNDAIHDRDSYIVGLGDYSNFTRPTIQIRLKEALLKDSEAHDELDTVVMKGTDELVSELWPLRHRILGLCEGHHYWVFNSGKTTTEYMCQKLNVRYLGFFAWMQLHISQNCQAGWKGIADITVTHGCGGGSSAASAVTKMQKMLSSWDVNMIFRAHSTDLVVNQAPPLIKASIATPPNNPYLYEQKRVILNAGSFMESYVIGKSGYADLANF